MAVARIDGVGVTLADTIGTTDRQRLVWLSLLAMPLIFPVALPGMATAVGALCLIIGASLLVGRSVPLPDWIARRELSERVRSLLSRMVGRVIRVIAAVSRPRLLSLTLPPVRKLHGCMLMVAGLSMMVPVPMISFDNVLPALAIVSITWGIRLRDGLLLLVGHVTAWLAAASVLALWLGGAYLSTQLLAYAGGAAP